MHIDAIYCSDLLRAHWTAQEISKHHDAPLTVSPLLREQHFGNAERKPYGEGGFIRQSGRSFRFEGGESAEEVRQRAVTLWVAMIKTIRLNSIDTLLPKTGHVVVVAHGIFNAELVSALLTNAHQETLPPRGESCIWL